MVGKGRDAEPRDADREPRRGAARAPTRSWTRVARGREPIPSTWSAAPSATCCSAAAAPTSTSSSRATPRRWPRGSAPSGRRARALRHRQGRARRPRGRHRRAPAPRPTPQPGRAARGRAGRRRSRPTSPAATSRSTRWRSRSRGEPRLIDPHGGRADLEAGPAAGPAPGAPSPTTRPGRCAPPATPPASASSSSRRPRRCCGRPTSAPSRPTAARPSCCGSRPKRARRAGFELLAEWGLVELREGGVELAARGRGAARERRPGARLARRAAEAVLAAALGPAGGERRAGRGRARSGPREAVELARGRDPVELVLARALGAEWLDDYLARVARGRRSRSTATT